jgi:hypothetical protein
MDDLITKTPINSKTSRYTLKEKEKDHLVVCKRLKNGQLASNESIKAFIYTFKMQNEHRFRSRIIHIFGTSFGKQT